MHAGLGLARAHTLSVSQELEAYPLLRPEPSGQNLELVVAFGLLLFSALSGKVEH